ncbi:MAG TPA: metallophosphoesterase family protein [Spirochaetota bacterium]|nr:metallophosphoesterase family protein [Spirochaetota bacterium]HPC42156.1 metallophosphoesterase family protein [Spirochaetota bacterium]HPL17052.1 metallophosphoesterase family protein [Spirochaetota bacterium]HQF09672.1 metallophosphoesterase family protein [Spirochaetota bacterium]HQH98450.1 metallophosphoesterase family protein [Spirochaetota bacterium]
MKILAIGDIHGEKKYFNAAADLIKSVDLVALCGDIARDGDWKSAEDVLSCIERYTDRIVGVHGNWDRSEVCAILERRGYSLHGRGTIIDGVGFFGVGGSTQTPMNTASEYSEEEFADFLSAGFKQIAGAAVSVLISHSPPHRVRDRTFIGIRGGSRAVRTFIENNGIGLCLAGHIHEAYGVEQLMGCQVANCGSFKKGRYSLVELTDSITVSQGRL